jgi:hypothetical protein
MLRQRGLRVFRPSGTGYRLLTKLYALNDTFSFFHNSPVDSVAFAVK